MRAAAACIPLLVLCLRCSSGSDEPAASCDPGVYPAAPDGASAVHVSARCGDGGDGSAARPYRTIQQAVAAAPAGAAVLIAPGSYAGGILINRTLSLIGAEARGILINSPDPYALQIVGAQGVVVEGVKIQGAIGAGVWLKEGAEATVRSCEVAGSTATTEGKFGFGVLATGGSTVRLEQSVVSGSASVGVMLHEAGGIIINNVLSQNKSGGVRVEAAPSEVTVQDNTLEGNSVLGLGAFDSRAIIINNQIRGTLAVDGQFGDGIVADSQASAPLDLTIRDNVVAQSARVGVLFSGNARGIIINNQADENGTKTAFGAGIWVQGQGADVEVSSNKVSKNFFVGVGFTASARGIIINNQIRETDFGATTSGGSLAYFMGDGLGVFAGSVVQARADAAGQNAMSLNKRSGIITDGAGAGTDFEQGVALGEGGEANDKGIILQNQATVDVKTPAAVTPVVATEPGQFPVKTDPAGLSPRLTF